jgi:hypothetical protein
MNNRGQAFSVFELMIAGVVAFAILIVLFMVINGVSLTSTQDPKTVISNGISAISPSGTTTTQNFVIRKMERVDIVDFVTRTGLDSENMFFVKGKLCGNDFLDVGNGAYVEYTGSTDLKARAKVVCKQTAELLNTSLDTYRDAEYDISVDPMSYCNDAQPCCAIILEKPTS